MTQKIKSRSESGLSAIFLPREARKINRGKDSCFADLFRVLSRLSGVVLASAKPPAEPGSAKTDVSRAILFPSLRFVVFAFCILNSSFLSAQTPYYHNNRTFTPVEIHLEGVPTLEELNAAADKLTDTVPGAIKLDTNGTYAIEKQAAIAIGYGSALSAWNAAAAYNGTPSNYPGKIFDNVGWVRGTKSVNDDWGAYLWVLQNRIAFQASTSAWWSTTNGIPVAITNVMVGSLGDYQATSNVVDIGPVIPSNFPGANDSDSGTYQVDISNVFYQLSIPDIWITPRYATTCVGGSNVQYAVAGTNIPQGVTWKIIPDGLTNGAVIQASNDWHYAGVTPGNVATNYKVHATSVDNTNFYDQVDLTVIKIDVWETNVYVGVSNTVSLRLTPDSTPDAQWEVNPVLPNGASIEGASSGTSIVINAGGVPTNYIVKAYATGLTNCFDTCTVTVIKVDIDTDTDNDGTIESDNNGEDQFKEYAPGRILCVNGFGKDANTDYLAEIKLALQPALTNGTTKLEAIDGGSLIKVWTTDAKTTEVTLPVTYNLATTNSPNSLFVDGIATGMVQLAFSYTAGSGGVTCTNKVAMLIIPTVSYAPGKAASAYVWAPLKTDSNTNNGNNIGWEDATEFENQIKDQGWPSITWLQDTTGDTDTNFGSCTLANYKGITNCGIYTIVSHGEEGGHPAIYAEYSTSGRSAVSNWIAGESSMTVESSPPGGGEPGFYYARVSSSWLTTNWKPAMDANRAISFWSICYSATANTGTGEDAVKECAGGRWRVGYIYQTSGSEAKGVNERFLKRMNGSTDNARRRTTGEAYESGNEYTSNVKMDGNDWTTLCPAPLADNIVFPDAGTGNRKGWGCILFDTYMSQTDNANDALVKQSGCPTSDHRWFGNVDGNYGLGFDFDKTGGAATTMRAVADKCRNEGFDGGRELDGNRVKPNQDNRDWSF